MPASLETRDSAFYLNGEKFRILSGAIHYFRVVPEYWLDRLQKLKFCGLNCVETYVPWNLHEEVKSHFKFDGNLDLRKFIQTAQSLGLFVILRPGPYICAEWDLGGLPSWLLSDPNMKLRSSYKPYLGAVTKYFNELLPIVKDLQHCKGGPIIAFQLENEYGSYGDDLIYMDFLKQTMLQNGIEEMLFTSDNGAGLRGDRLDGVLMTLNLQEKEHGYLMHEYVKNIKQFGQPLMVSELWTGWFDHWTEGHHVVPVDRLVQTLNWILDEGGSFNLYMFHGGTNFGFLNGANEMLNTSDESLREEYNADVTSYDYDAPVSECGQLTEKFFAIKNVLKERGLLKSNDDIAPCPPSITSQSYGELLISQYIELGDILKFIKKIESDHLQLMEELPINEGCGQSFGFILYQCFVEDCIDSIKFVGTVRDRAIVLLNGTEVAAVNNRWENYFLKVNSDKRGNVLGILVENMGRVNYAGFKDDTMNQQRKGLKGLLVNGGTVQKWEIYPMEFKGEFIKMLRGSDAWRPWSRDVKVKGPCLYRSSPLRLANGGDDNDGGSGGNDNDRSITTTTTTTTTDARDTFLSTNGWTKGVAFINDFNLGRYWNVGPQKNLYIPAPLINKGSNEIIIFELHEGSDKLSMVASADLGSEEVHEPKLPFSAKVQLYALKSALKMGSWVWQVVKPFVK